MTEQKLRISESVDYIKSNLPVKTEGKITSALITYNDPLFIKSFKVIKKINYSDIPPKFNSTVDAKGEIILAQNVKDENNILILNGHINFYNGFSMRDAAHPVYVLNELGIKKVIIVDEVGHLNPRFSIGGISLIYDHINLMGDNPLIGENDETLGTRFPDMSNPYDAKWYLEIESLLRERKHRFYPSVYLGITGPETETEAECRFYRETGSDIAGYSIVPENIAAVHARIKCAAFGMISRELVADRLEEISEESKLKNRRTAEKSFTPIIEELL